MYIYSSVQYFLPSLVVFVMAFPWSFLLTVFLVRCTSSHSHGLISSSFFSASRELHQLWCTECFIPSWWQWALTGFPLAITANFCLMWHLAWQEAVLHLSVITDLLMSLWVQWTIYHTRKCIQEGLLAKSNVVILLNMIQCQIVIVISLFLKRQ